MNLLTTDITWPQLKGLYQVFKEDRTRLKLFTNPYILRLKKERRLLKFKTGNDQIIEKGPGFDAFFKEKLLGAYERYARFFEQTGVAADGKRPYNLYDLETLLYIYANKPILQNNLTTERAFSAQFFKGSKYLEYNTSVSKAVLKLFDLDAFPKNDPKVQQWRLVIDCPEPERIVLCENLDALKQPDSARSLNTELWYVGGNNIRILEFLSATQLQLPLYYMCDWDLAGLQIYGRVKGVMAEKGCAIRLLKPYDILLRLPVDSPYHNSSWFSHLPLSGLAAENFSAEEQVLIGQLIRANEWIEEESQDFETLLRFNKVV